MKNKILIINSIIDDKPIRYLVWVNVEIAEKYAKIRLEEPGLTEIEAFKRAKLNSHDKP